jgi:hypothetical protein
LYNCTLIGNSAAYEGGGAKGSSVSHCTLMTNWASFGGGVSSCRLSDCTLTGNSGSGFGGGAEESTLNNCTLIGNRAGYGGGASICVLSNCTLVGNSALSGSGGGADRSTVNNCILTGNSASNYSGGGVYSSTLTNCALSANAAQYGAGAASATLNNCTLSGNFGGGAFGCALSNCIVYFNGDTNYDSSSTLTYCCTTPLPASGVGNISSDPQLASFSHLSASSPCRGVGNAAYASGLDIDGEAWLDPPSIGCDEYHSGAVTGPLSVGIATSYTNVLRGFTVHFTALIQGRTTRSTWEFGDGVTLANQPYPSHAWTSLGDYPVVLRAYNESNPGGISATVTVHVLTGVHYVAADSAAPVSPYTSWATAATNIQDAVTAANEPGEQVLVLVTNGAYAPIHTDNPLSVRSVNGPQFTFIDGGGGGTCVSLATGASVSGFTLTNGTTGASGGTVSNCLMIGNSGGAYSSVLKNCVLSGNFYGGAAGCTLNNCALIGNPGFAADYCQLTNCTLTGNGSGAYRCALANCIAYFNTRLNYDSVSTLSYCCTTPQPTNGVGNISLDPQLASASHLSAVSPCRGAGNVACTNGTDIDGEAWLSPPSIGCDEYHTGAVTGPLIVGIAASYTNVAVGFAVQLTGFVEGRTVASSWDFGDGVTLSNQPYTAHVWTVPGDYVVVLRAFNESNPGGIGATLTVHVVPQPVHYVAADSPSPVSPYSSWATAATNIQDAVDAATMPGALVRVTNGAYATGGRGGTRALVDKPLLLQSVNGPQFTLIGGGHSNRCVSLASNASLSGFALTNGFSDRGGGLWCESASAVVSNCVLTGNTASSSGGGAYQGTLFNCTLSGNSTINYYDYYYYITNSGGGAFGCVLNSCTVTNNAASVSNYNRDYIRYGVACGGGAAQCALTNCTITGNSASTYNDFSAYGRGPYTVYTTAEGGGVAGSTLSNCVLTSNSASNYYTQSLDPIYFTVQVYSTASGGGAWDSALINCALTNNTAWIEQDDYDYRYMSAYTSGGGSDGCTLNNSVLSGNSAGGPYGYASSDFGGGASYCVMSNCTMTGNSAAFGGGGAGSTLNNCTLSDNYADGAYGCTLRNCALVGNSGRGARSSTLNNCTVTGNDGGGASGCELTNCIVYSNTGTNCDPSCVLNYCCTTPQPVQGIGNISSDPQLASYLHLSAFSPCIGKGNPATSSGVDIDGEPWANPPSIGCDEHHAGAVSGPLSVRITASHTNVATGFPVTFKGLIEGRTDLSVWQFGDGTVEINEPDAAHAWSAPGDYVVSLWAFNESNPGGISATVTVHVITEVHYVAASNANPVAPYSSWGTAATNLQDAITVAVVPGAQVLVTNGIYPPILWSSGPLVVRSVNGAQFTIIDGAHSNVCATLWNDVSLTGFTLRNGYGTYYGGGAVGNGNGTLSNCVLAGNSAYSGGGAYGCALNDCTLTGNSATDSGGGSYRSTLNNCTLSANSAAKLGGGVCGCMLNNCTLAGNWTVGSPYNGYGGGGGGGAAECVLNNCTLTGNSATNSGGGAWNSTLNTCTLIGNWTSGGSYEGGGGAAACTLNDCTLTGNWVSYEGGGAWNSTLNNCVLTDNLATNVHGSGYGGGAYECRLNNCAVAGNSTTGFGGGGAFSVLNNCTLTGNSAPQGGGEFGGSLNNSVVYFNTGTIAANYDFSTTINYCCTTPLPTNGVGNISSNPRLASFSHLSTASPCRGAGNPLYAGGVDIDREAWLNPPSIGCDEYHAGAATGPLEIEISASFTNVLSGFGVQLSALIQGRATASAWDFGDGTSVTNQPYTSHTWTALGDYTVVLRGYNESNPGGIAAAITIHVVSQPIHYVMATSSNPVAPYNSWPTAATNIQDAVDAATVPGALVLVTDGIYATGGRPAGGVASRVVVDRVLTLQSVNGPQLTVIDGGHSVRCVYLAENAILTGFTLTNGNAPYVPAYGGSSGGGVWCQSSNTVAVSNCLVGGSSAWYGGGAYGGMLANCTLISNTAAEFGGGAYFCTLNNCLLITNGAIVGGGAYACTLTNCSLTGNSSGGGSGAYSCTLNNCSLTANSAHGSGGGAENSTLNNCTLAGNSTDSSGGGAASSTLNNCTLAGNSATGPYGGGGVFDCTLNNCIAWFNSATNAPNFDPSSTLSYCCTAPQPAAGIGNITNAPMFVNTNDWANLRLQSASPCINAGNNSYVTNTTDLDGSLRIAGGTVDVGAYEFQGPASRISYAWLSQYGLLPANAATDTADPDGDGMNNWQEWIAGTDPTDGTSVLRLLAPVPTPPGLLLRWNSDTNHAYFVERATSLGPPAAFNRLRSHVPGLAGLTTFVDTAPPGNAALYRIGTGPTNAAAPFSLQPPVFVPASVVLTWSSVTNRTYFLERSTSLVSPMRFTPVATNVPGEPGTTTFTDTNAAGGGPFFYRVRVGN